MISDFIIRKNLLDEKDYVILKSLGKWIGLISLGHNKPILASLFDIQERIYQSLKNGFTIPLIFFLVQILQEVKLDSFYSIRMPYINKLFSMLHEIHDVPWVHDFSKKLILYLFAKQKVNLKDLFLHSNIRQQFYNYPKLSFKVDISPQISQRLVKSDYQQNSIQQVKMIFNVVL